MLPDNVIASLVLCERVLQEKDDVPSAIRIVDVFFPREGAEGPVVSFAGLALVRSALTDEEEHPAKLFMVYPDGKQEQMLPDDASVSLKKKLPDAPGGTTFQFNFNIKGHPLGMYFLHLEIDGQRLASAMFTLALRAQSDASGIDQPDQPAS